MRMSWTRLLQVSTPALFPANRSLFVGSLASVGVCMLLSAFSVGLGHQQKTAAGGPPYPGTWKATYQGKVFAILDLKNEDHRVFGKVSAGQVNVDPNGEVNEVTKEAEGGEEIFDVRDDGRTLSFKAKDGNDVDQYEMKLTGENSAELKLVLKEAPPEGTPAPKPFKMIRTKSQRSWRTGPSAS